MDVPSKCCRELQKTRLNVISCGPPDTLFRWTRGESDAASEWSYGPWLTLEAAAKKKMYQENPRGNCSAKCSMLCPAVLPKHCWARPWVNSPRCLKQPPMQHPKNFPRWPLHITILTL